ncbi:MAG: iron hydrogenase [Patescibacteria group bacterium]|jgi:hypothetical protein
MSKTVASTITKVQSVAMVKFLALLGIATFVPMFVHLQWLTGPLVNAILIITVVVVGVREALLIALIPSSIALAYGLLPLPLAPMIPFIMISNAFLVWFFDVLRDRGYWLAVVVAALIKFVWLYAIVHLLMKSILAGSLFNSLAILMSWPQLVTALIGGVLAWIFLKWLKFV